MGCHEKFCYIHTRDGQKYYYGVVLHKVLYRVRHISIMLGHTMHSVHVMTFEYLKLLRLYVPGEVDNF